MRQAAALRRLMLHPTRKCLLPLAGLLIVGPAIVYGDDISAAPALNDWGEVGLLQTPTARMASEGEIAFDASHVAPYTRYNVMLQPLPWLEGTFRYTSINNQLYGSTSLSGHQTYKDKSIDARVRIWNESRILPAVAVGIHDLGGTGLFASEYVVANKRAGPIDASLGMAWGYLGSRGDIGSPFGIVSSKFKTRPVCNDGTGKFCSNSYFRGRAALFGGVSYQTPWSPLLLKLEYEANNYKHEPFNHSFRQKTPLNVGAVFRVNRNIDLGVAWERGDQALLSLTLHTNLVTHVPTEKLLDPPPPPPPDVAAQKKPEQVDWPAVSKQLKDNAGLEVSKIARRGSEIVVAGEQSKYFYSAEGVGRTARVLDDHLDPSIDWYTVESTRESMPIIDTSVHRTAFDALLDHRLSLDDFQRSVEQDTPMPQQEEVLYQAPANKFQGAASVSYGQTTGGPNAFILYQIAANYGATYRFMPDLWWSGMASANLINNYGKFHYDAPSGLPRVRTDIRKYLTYSRLTMPDFQVTTAHRLDTDLYGMAYAGMLESMFGGVGGEMLYRPVGEHWALGADVNWVKQRGFDQDFAFRRYHVVTGQATAYFDTGIEDLTVALSAGRYLAGDWGGTLDVSRHFRNGVVMGAYATLTNASSKQFGEGSFDKGIYISIPFDLLLPRSTVNRANFMWEPLLRDGGARLHKSYSLYTLTNDRDEDNFEDNLQYITH